MTMEAKKCEVKGVGLGFFRVARGGGTGMRTGSADPSLTPRIP